MQKFAFVSLFLLFHAFLSTTPILAEATQPVENVLFTPPPQWTMVEPNALPKNVKAMVIGKGKGNFPPSINLGIEKYPGTLRQYLKIIKSLNESQGTPWKDLGSIRTAAGEASLSQVDTATEWGEIRMMHVILNKDGMIYMLTAAAKKDEFPQYYKLFFESMQSLRFAATEN